jgi:predicted aspartyl protease
MSVAFNGQQGPILAPAEVAGPAGTVQLRLILDTGATRTLIHIAKLLTAGYDPAAAPARIPVTTASGVTSLPRLAVQKLTALGQDRTPFLVLGHTLPPSVASDGLLGLDFFRGQVLTLDFQSGQITLS